MRYRLFGPTGLRVSELSLGAMTFGEEWGWGSDRAESQRVLDAYAAAGGNFIDSANVYTNGASERMLGEMIAGRRHRFVIATKYGLSQDPSDPNASGSHRKNLVRSVEDSLRRLGTDYIDLYWVHAWDFLTPVEEVMRALDDLVRSGKVLYVGISDAPSWYVAKGNTLAALRGWTPFAGLQIQYSLIERTSERELLPYARSEGLAVTAWSPLGGGVLTGKYGAGAERSRPEQTRYVDSDWGQLFLVDRNYAIAGVLKGVAEEAGCSMSQAALAWIRQKDPSIIPIVGARRLSQLEHNLASLEVSLGEAQMQVLEDATAVDRGFPTDFLGKVRHLVLSDVADRIESDRTGY